MFKIKFLIRICILTLMACGALFISPAYSATPSDTSPAPVENTDSTGEDHSAVSETAPSYESAFIKMIVTLVALLLFIIITFWVIRKMSQGRLASMNYNRAIKILEKRPLSAKSMLYILEIEGKKILISESQLEVRGISTLDTVPDDD